MPDEQSMLFCAAITAAIPTNTVTEPKLHHMGKSCVRKRKTEKKMAWEESKMGLSIYIRG